MPIIVKLQDIDEAIENLRYKNETTLKSRLLRAVREYYQDDASAESLQSIDAEELVKTVWETGDDSDLLKTKRKNFSSLKSSVNSDLKKLYAEGKNTQGIVIGHNNVFSISDEAKDKALAGIMDVFKEKGIDTQSKISEILSVLSDILSTSISETDAENTKEEIDRLKNILGGISGKLGLSLQDIVRRAGAVASGGAQISGSDTTPRDMPGKGEDLSGFIRGGLSEIDKGLQGLAREIEEASASVAQTGVVESVRRALQDIVQTLKDSGTDTTGKARKIMAAVEGMLTDAINAPGNELSGNQAGQLKQIFHEMTEGAREAPPAEGNVEADKMATPVQIAGGELLARVSSILGDGGLSATDHPSGWQDHPSGWQDHPSGWQDHPSGWRDHPYPEGHASGWPGKISKIMAAVNETIGDTLDHGGTGLSDKEIAGIKEMMGSIAGNVKALAQEAMTGAEAAGSIQDSMRTALEGITEALQDAGTDTTGKAKKMMAAIEGMLADAIDASGNELSGDQAEQLKQIFHEISEGVGEALPAEGKAEADKIATPAQIAGGQLVATVSSILGDGGLSAGDKISQIMAAVNNMLDVALGEADGGLGSADQAKIQEIMANITSRLEALAGLEIVEEEVLPPAGVVLPPAGVIAEDADGTVEFVEEILEGDAAQQTVDLEETGPADIVIEDASVSLTDEFEEITLPPERVPFREEVVSPPEEVVSPPEEVVDGDAAKQTAGPEDSGDFVGTDAVMEDAITSATDEVVEVVEEVSGADTEGLTEEIVQSAESAGGDTETGVQESMRTALQGIIEALHDAGTDTTDKAKKMMAAVEGMLADAIDASGNALSGDHAGQLKQIFHEMTQGDLLEMVSSILGDEGISNADHPCGWQDKIGKIMAAVNNMIGKALSEASDGLSNEDQAKLREMMAGLSGNLEAISHAALAGLEIVEEIVEEGAGDSFKVIEDPGVVDLAGKAACTDETLKITLPPEGVVLPPEGVVSPPEGVVLPPEGVVEEISGEALESGADVEGLTEEIAQGSEAAGGDAEAGVQESMRTALQGIIEALHDAGTDTTDKAKKMMAAVEGMLADAIDASGNELSGDQAEQLKQIFHEISEGVGEELPAEGHVAADKTATPAQIAGGHLLATVSSILGNGELSAGDHPVGWQGKISQIMTAVNKMLDQALGEVGGGLGSADQAKIQEIMADITGRLEALAGLEIVEEEVSEPEGVVLPPEGVVLPPEGLDESAAADTDVIEEGTDKATGDIEEIIEGEGLLQEEADAAQSTEEPAGIIEDLSESSGESVDDMQTATDGTGLGTLAETEVVEVGTQDSVDEGAEFVEADSAVPDGLEEISDETEATKTQSAANAAETGASEEFEEQDFIEEIVEDTGNAASGVQVTPADSNIDSDLREKADLLTRLAEAAGVLSGMGPDLSGSVYTEEEIRGKAQFLSEEFDRYLSIRDKFFNAHILIKGGDYLVGGAHLAKSVLAEQIVTLPDFYISKFPVTNALFEIFVEQTGYVTTAEKYGYSLVYFPRMQRSRDPITGVERFSLHNQAYSKKVPGACWHRPHGPDSSLYLKRTHPVVHVSLEDACAFAVWTGKRLPSEIEWEASARTAHGLTYPWGSKWQDDACNIEKSLHGDTTPVDRYVKFANSAGVADMLGNILEWTSDVIGDKETSDTFIVKGAGWIAHDEISLTDRHYIEKNTASNILGFRCVAI